MAYTSNEELQEKVIHIGRVSKTVKGGRNMRFSALVIVGDGKGHVGKGIGKAAEVPEAIRKAIEEAKKNIIEVPVLNGTIPHATVGEFSASQIIMKPAQSGTGVIAGGPVRAILELAGIRNVTSKVYGSRAPINIIAGGPVRAVCELAGITDIRTKSIGSNNPNNMVNATLEGLKGLKSIEEVAKVRGKSVAEIR